MLISNLTYNNMNFVKHNSLCVTCYDDASSLNPIRLDFYVV